MRSSLAVELSRCIYLTLACSGLSIATSGCGSADDASSEPGPSDEDLSWTIFVYGHADHNLANSLVADISEMSRAQLDDNVRVVVLADWDASQKAASGEAFPTGSEWYLVPGNQQPPELVSKEDEQDLDDPAVLTESIRRAFTENAADRYGLVLWDHGGAWSGGYGGDSRDGENQSPAGMTVNDLAGAVRAGLDLAELSGSRPLEFLAFDTCLMGGAEVAYALRDLTKVYIANAEIDYGNGWDYESTLTFLSEHPEVTPRELALTEIEHWNAHHASAGPNDALLRSHVAIDTEALEPLATAWAEVAKGLVESGGYSAIELARQMSFVMPPYSLLVAEASKPTDSLRDLGQVLDALGPVTPGAESMRGALDAALIGNAQGQWRESQVGLHLELPLAASIPTRVDQYETLASAWNTATEWSGTLRWLASHADTQGPTIGHELATLDGGTPSVSFSIQDSDAAAARVDVGVVDPSSPSQIVLFGVVAVAAVEAGATYEFPWSQTLLTLPGEDGGQQPVTVDVWLDRGKDASSGELVPPLLAIAGIFGTAKGEQAPAALLFQDGDSETGLIVVNTGSASVFPIATLAAESPGATFTPVLTSIDAETGKPVQINGTAIPLPSGPLSLAASAAPPGSYVLVTTGADVWGNLNTVIDLVEVAGP